MSKIDREVSGEVVDRLRESLRVSREQEQERAQEAGRRWASNDAEAIQLQRLERCRASMNDHEWDLSFDPDRSSAYSAAEWVYFAIEPGCHGSRHAAADFWEAALGDEHRRDGTSDAFIQGFAEGALELWDEVKDQL